MAVAYIAGALGGLGIFVLFCAFFPTRPGLAASMAALDAHARRRAAMTGVMQLSLSRLAQSDATAARSASAFSL